MGYLHLCITCLRHLESFAPNFPIRLNKWAAGDSLFLWVSCSLFRVSTQRDIWAWCHHFQVCAPGSLKINIFLQVMDLHKYLFSYLPSSGTFVAAAAKSLQSCPTLCDPRDGSPPGSTVPGFSRQYWSGWPLPSPQGLLSSILSMSDTVTVSYNCISFFTHLTHPFSFLFFSLLHFWQKRSSYLLKFPFSIWCLTMAKKIWLSLHLIYCKLK